MCVCADARRMCGYMRKYSDVYLYVYIHTYVHEYVFVDACVYVRVRSVCVCVHMECMCERMCTCGVYAYVWSACMCTCVCVWSSCVKQCTYSVNANNGVQTLTRSIKSWQAAALLCCGNRKDVTWGFLQSEVS